MKIEAVKDKTPALLFESKGRFQASSATTEAVTIRRPPDLEGNALKLAKLKAEIDFDRVKEMVRRVTPSSAYPPLEGVDRLANLFGKSVL